MGRRLEDRYVDHISIAVKDLVAAEKDPKVGHGALVEIIDGEYKNGLPERTPCEGPS